MTILYLGVPANAEAIASIATFREEARKPAILASFFYKSVVKNCIEQFKPHGYKMMLDSGAYSAWNSKKPVDMQGLIAEAKSGNWGEVASLDVVGNPEQSRLNAEIMLKAGANVIPTFHFGEPWEYLLEYAKKYDKVALGGIVGVKSVPDKTAWVEQCFARTWPKKFHCFGWMSEMAMMRFPFHSVDSSGWEQSPLCFGNFMFAAGQNLGLNRKKARAKVGAGYLRPEILHYLRMESKVQARWAGEFRKQGWI